MKCRMSEVAGQIHCTVEEKAAEKPIVQKRLMGHINQYKVQALLAPDSLTVGKVIELPWWSSG